MPYSQKTKSQPKKSKTCPGCKTPKTCTDQNRCRYTGQRLS